MWRFNKTIVLANYGTQNDYVFDKKTVTADSSLHCFEKDKALTRRNGGFAVIKEWKAPNRNYALSVARILEQLLSLSTHGGALWVSHRRPLRRCARPSLAPATLSLAPAFNQAR